LWIIVENLDVRHSVVGQERARLGVKGKRGYDPFSECDRYAVAVVLRSTGVPLGIATELDKSSLQRGGTVET
jgi:hypothetical protein